MGMDARTATNTDTAPMPTDPRLLTMTQWLSPSYPVGAYAFSHGLEAACQAGTIRDAADLEAWLGLILSEGSGWCDAVWIALAARGARPVCDLDDLASAFAASSERARESRRQGAAFARITCDVWGVALEAVMMPVVLGDAARQLDLPVEEVIALYLQGFLSNLVAAAQRLMPLGQTEAQGVLARLSTVCLDCAMRAVQADESDIASCAFASDIASMRHETLETRIFQS